MNMLLSWNCVHIPRKQGHYRGDATQKSSSGGHCGWVIPTGLSEPYPAPATSQLLCLSVPLSACGPHSLGEQLSKRIFSSPMAKCMFLWTRQTWVLFLCLTQPCPWSLLLQIEEQRAKNNQDKLKKRKIVGENCSYIYINCKWQLLVI